MTEPYTLIPRGADTPDSADFCLVMDTDDMEPVISRGERVFVSRRESPEEMEVGLFYYKGRVYCRQYCEDYSGALLLLCANPQRESKSLRLDKSEREKCLCLGRVLLDKKPPRPMYV